jgi:hypothetical protein
MGGCCSIDAAVVAQLVGRSRQGDSPLDRLTDRERAKS